MMPGTGGTGRPPRPPSFATLAQRLHLLSPREREVMDEMALGASNKAIAQKLGISEATVKAHVQLVLRKLRLTSRVQTSVLAPQRKEPS